MENNLKKLRDKLKLTQKQVAQNVGISTSYYGMLEQADRRPNLSLAYKLAKFFDTSIEDIFFNT